MRNSARKPKVTAFIAVTPVLEICHRQTALTKPDDHAI